LRSMASVNNFIKINLYGELITSREVHELQDGRRLHPDSGGYAMTIGGGTQTVGSYIPMSDDYTLIIG
jgi:ribosomal protein S6E (S10)